MTTSGRAGNDVLLAQPRALIVTIYGLYARETDGWLSIAALIRLMAELGVEEAAVRSATSRLKTRGLLESRRVAGAAGYGLSAGGQQILADGDRRIFRGPGASTADGWLLAVFSVPEHQRARRHALRSRLAWLGFGTVSAGVWIAPGQLADETRDVLTADGLAAYVSLFTAGHLAFGDVREKIGEWWDLDRLERLYQAFIDAAGPVLARWERAASHRGHAGGRLDAGQAFADYVRVLTAWRRLPYLDPGLPPEFLPADWHGARAAELFARTRDLLGGPARAHVLAVTGSSAN
ncbi:MAG TPA: PaaX family transcriptional regulator C-terminal domain-containing protein [Streptosporangiaceae bacterium]|nr:PaaX family transcriptional regulator C-terminal domain-containing protein [Streptosporangiaceae bacterium]